MNHLQRVLIEHHLTTIRDTLSVHGYPDTVENLDQLHLDGRMERVLAFTGRLPPSEAIKIRSALEAIDNIINYPDSG